MQNYAFYFIYTRAQADEACALVVDLVVIIIINRRNRINQINQLFL